MMRYSIEPGNRIYIRRYGFLSFAKNMGTHATKVAKKLIDSALKSPAMQKNCFQKSKS